MICKACYSFRKHFAKFLATKHFLETENFAFVHTPEQHFSNCMLQPTCGSRNLVKSWPASLKIKQNIIECVAQQKSDLCRETFVLLFCFLWFFL